MISYRKQKGIPLIMGKGMKMQKNFRIQESAHLTPQSETFLSHKIYNNNPSYA